MSLWREFNYCLSCKNWVHSDDGNQHINAGHVVWGAGTMPGARYYFGRRMFAVYIRTISQMRVGRDNGADASTWLPARKPERRIVP